MSNYDLMKINHVLLLSLPAVMRPSDRYLDDGHSFHLGLAYLAGVLRDNGYEVKILDCFVENPQNIRLNSQTDGWCEYGLEDEEIIECVRQFSPGIIGITIPFSCQHYVAEKVAKAIKVVFPNTPIVAGGNHVTAVPELLDRQLFDYLIMGEGEYAFLELVRSIERGVNPERIPGLYDGDKKYHQFIERLDDLPLPAIDLLPLEKLWKSGKRWINMIATRGCVYNCVFCSIHTIMGYEIRRRSIDNIIAEIRHWKKLFNIQEVYFEDDNLTTNIKWAKELFRRIAECKFNIRFYARNGIRADTVDRELLELMKRAGFFDFMISPETGSQRTLDEIIGKKMNLEDCEKAVKLATELGLGVNAFFVVGFPEETLEDLNQTLNYALYLKNFGCVGFWVSTATPYPGTRFFEKCVSKGEIDLENIDFRKFRTVDYAIQSENFSPEELIAFREKMMQLLSSDKNTLLRKLQRGFKLFIKDPDFFIKKVRYKLGV